LRWGGGYNNNEFDRVMQAQIETANKIGYLSSAINDPRHRYLIIFDNFEDMVDATKEPHTIKDDLVRSLLETLTTNLRESRVMITSKFDFSFISDDKCQGNILSVTLPDLTRKEISLLIENIPSLCNATDEEKANISERSGGNPYVIDLFTAAADDRPIKDVLDDIKEIQKKFVDVTLLDKLYEWLPNDATREFFRRISVYREPVTKDFLEAMEGNPERIGYLLHKRLLNKISGDMYEMHSNTQKFAFELLEKVDGDSVRDAQITAADKYFDVGSKKGNINYHLESRGFYFRAGEYDKAGELVQKLTKPLHTRGFIDLVRNLNEETIRTTSGQVKAAALHHLGIIHQDQGRYDEAMEMYQKSMKIEKELGDKSGIAGTLHQMGNLHFMQDRYDEAMEMYQKSMKIEKELGDKSGIASTLHNIGVIHQNQGRYDEAMEMYQKSMKIEEEIGNKRAIASTLHQIGNLHFMQGRYDEAMEMYQKSMKIEKELGDKSGIAITLGQMGRIFHVQKNYKEALRCYLYAFGVFDELKSPYKDLAGKDIMRLKDEMGEELFDKYYNEIISEK
jgi:tetratricopeptide (TPR) repeat protein